MDFMNGATLVLVLFASKKLRKQCNSLKVTQRTWGTRRGKLVMQRLDEITDADNLAILKLVHPRCHPLTGDRQGQWSLDLEHPYRLIFEVANDPIPELESGGVDPRRVTVVRILEVEDTHGR